MPKNRNQSDLVKSFISQHTETGVETTEKIRMGVLYNAFTTQQLDFAVSTETIKVELPYIHQVSGTSRRDIAEAIVDGVLLSIPGLIELTWDTTKKVVEVVHSPSLQVSPQLTQEQLTDTVEMVLKCRKNITNIHWRMSDPFIEVSYIV